MQGSAAIHTSTFDHWSLKKRLNIGFTFTQTAMRSPIGQLTIVVAGGSRPWSDLVGAIGCSRIEQFDCGDVFINIESEVVEFVIGEGLKKSDIVLTVPLDVAKQAFIEADKLALAWERS